MIGTYRIYKNGELVCEKSNLITNFGKDTIWKYLSNSVSDWGGALAMGSGNTAATVTDTALAFEFARTAVLLKSPISSATVTAISGSGTTITYTANNNFSAGQTVSITGSNIAGYNLTNATIATANSTSFTVTNTATGTNTNTAVAKVRGITLRGSIDPSVSGIIRELGLFNNLGGNLVGGYDSRIITSFDEGVNSNDPSQWSTGTYSSTQWATTATNNGSLVGSGSVVLTANTASRLGGGTVSGPGALSIDISRFSPSDIVRFQFVPTNASTTNTVTIVLYDDQPTPATLTYAASNLTLVAFTPYILSIPFSSFTASGTFNYTISQISVTTDQTALSADCITIDNTDITDTTYGLVSRTVLATPITKSEGDSMDIEYQLSLNLS